MVQCMGVSWRQRIGSGKLVERGQINWSSMGTCLLVLSGNNAKYKVVSPPQCELSHILSNEQCIYFVRSPKYTVQCCILHLHFTMQNSVKINGEWRSGRAFLAAAAL